MSLKGTPCLLKVLTLIGLILDVPNYVTQITIKNTRLISLTSLIFTKLKAMHTHLAS